MYIILKKSSKKTTFRTGLRRSFAVFCRNLRNCDLRINNKNLRIFDLRTGIDKKFAILSAAAE